MVHPNAEALSIDAARALLEWQIELGADEGYSETPINRYDLTDSPAPAAREKVAAREVGDGNAAPPPQEPVIDAVQVARDSAAAVMDLAALAAAQSAFDLCDLKRGARNFVFAEGNPAARVMIIGEAPGLDEDREGLPFVGRAGQLLNRMFAAIGLARTAQAPHEALYITNVLPWRPPQNRDPEPDEIAMMQPFLARHVDLVNPDLIVLMGNTPCAAVLGRRGILRLRGTWTEGFGRPALPMTHPAYLLRNPAAKREAWADLLDIRARLAGG